MLCVFEMMSRIRALHPCKTHTHTTLTARVIIRNAKKMHENRGQGGVELDFKFRISICLSHYIFDKKQLHSFFFLDF